MDLSIDAVPKLSDDELFKALKKCNLTVGPITSTTRSIYEKRLIGHLLNPNPKPAETVKAAEKVTATETNPTIEIIKPIEKSKPVITTTTTTTTIERSERVEPKSRPEPTSSFDSLYSVRKDDITKSIDSKIQLLRNTESFSQPSLSTPQKITGAIPSTPQTSDKFANRLNSYGLLNSTSKSSAKDYTSSIQTLSAMKQSTVAPSVASSIRDKACDKQLFASTFTSTTDSSESLNTLRKRADDEPTRISGRPGLRDARDAYESKANRVLGTTAAETKTTTTTTPTAPTVTTPTNTASGSSNVKTFILVALFTIIAYFLFIQYQAMTAPPNIEL